MANITLLLNRTKLIIPSLPLLENPTALRTTLLTDSFVLPFRLAADVKVLAAAGAAAAVMVDTAALAVAAADIMLLERLAFLFEEILALIYFLDALNVFPALYLSYNLVITSKIVVKTHTCPTITLLQNKSTSLKQQYIPILPVIKSSFRSKGGGKTVKPRWRDPKSPSSIPHPPS